MATRADLPALEAALGALPDPERSPGACCAALYENPGVRWVLGGELHPGGEATTRRAFELIDFGPGDRLLDVGCGQGESALLAARERGAEAVGLDLGASAIAAAEAAARAKGLDGRARFVRGDAAALPFGGSSFDAVLLECTLSTLVDKERAIREVRRVLRPGGRVAISDVVVDPERLPEPLRGPLAGLACVGGALDARGYEELLAGAGLRVEAVERVDDAAARLAQRVEDRLRGARLLGFDEVEAAIELVRVGRRAIAEGTLGYAIFAAAR
jgi:arsenite methyltransferase